MPHEKNKKKSNGESANVALQLVTPSNICLLGATSYVQRVRNLSIKVEFVYFIHPAPANDNFEDVIRRSSRNNCYS